MAPEEQKSDGGFASESPNEDETPGRALAATGDGSRSSAGGNATSDLINGRYDYHGCRDTSGTMDAGSECGVGLAMASMEEYTSDTITNANAKSRSSSSRVRRPSE